MICRICKEDKSKDSFFKGRAYCKDCYNKKTKERKARKKQDNWNRLMDNIGGQKCSMCGFTDEWRGCYDFHHIDDTNKEIDVSRLLGGGYEQIKTEADKCILLCANCHRKIHRREEIGKDK